MSGTLLPARGCVAVAALAVAVSGCGGSGDRSRSPLPMTEEAYVEVMARLEHLRRRSFPGSGPEAREAAADSARTGLLAERGLSADQLLRFAERVGSDPARMEAISERIAALADSLREIERTEARDTAAAKESVPAAADPGAAAGAGVPDTLSPPSRSLPARPAPDPRQRLTPPVKRARPDSRETPPTAADST
jgi:hypothetical protein